MSYCSFELTAAAGFATGEDALRSCAELICGAEFPSGDCEVSLLICGDEAMRAYNRQYRGHDAVTDVLSFSTRESCPEADGSTRAATLCDIIIDINQLDRQKGSNTLERELMQVFIHGLLHAFGYDHIRSQDEKIMTEKEQRYSRMMEGTH